MRAVLTFHGVDDSPGPLSWSPRAFGRLLAELRKGSLPVISLDALLGPQTRRGIALTFDDGMRSVFTAALPILREHGMPAHLFLCTGAVDGAAVVPAMAQRDMLTWDMVGTLHEAGVAIESHTHRHPDLRSLPDVEIDAECEAADALIERRVGRRPRYFAYPFGYHDARVVRHAAVRYAAAFTTRLAPLPSDADLARLPRLDAHYLRSPLAYRHLEAPALRAYLRLRRLLRLVRGSE
jgi:peptidoglycan/xylan/chitin deacetylase (PgdA/CDA1 family)